MTKVSIIIPTYKRVNELRFAVESVLSQSHQEFEIIVVDNYSGDGTDEMLAAFEDPRIQLLKIQNGGVIARSRNIGLRAAVGDYVAFLDSDDWWHPQKLSSCLHTLKEGFDVTYHDLIIKTSESDSKSTKRISTWPLKGDPFIAFLKSGNAIANSSVMVRRCFVKGDNLQTEDADLVGMEDFDLWLRLAKGGARFKRCPEALGCYRLADNFTNPERSLKALSALLARHPEISDKTAGYWLPYQRGRALYLSGFVSEARSSLKGLFRRKAPLAIYAKAIKMLLI